MSEFDIEKINSDLDIEKIKDDFYRVIQYSQDILDPQIDDLFENWFKAKRDFISIFGGLRFCLPEPVTFDLDEQAKYNRIDDFITHLRCDYDFNDLASIVEYNRKSFFSNKISYLPSWAKDDYPDVKIDMKLLKSFKYFIENEETLKKLQDEASMIIQESKVEGYLYFSVHPLDFLSSSENTYNWRSCHSLDGDYRAGNLSYMCDESTIICYLTTKENKKLPHFPESVLWNSKKWRMLLFFSDNWDMVYAGRQYPFFSKSALDMVREKMIIPSGFHNKKFFWSPWTNYEISKINDPYLNEEMCLSQRYIPVRGELFDIKNIVKDAKYSQHYNDILYSSIYVPYYMKLREYDPFDSEWKYDVVETSNLKFNIGSKVNCLHCGKEKIEHNMVCVECDQTYYDSPIECVYQCAYCGTTMINEDEVYYVTHDDIPYCYHCYREYTNRCGKCGVPYPVDDMRYSRRCACNICAMCADEFEI